MIIRGSRGESDCPYPVAENRLAATRFCRRLEASQPRFSIRMGNPLAAGPPAG